MKLHFYLLVMLLLLSSCNDKEEVIESNSPISTTTLYILDTESLYDWDFGVTDGQKCLVYKTDSQGGITACAFDTNSGSEYDFFVEISNTGKVTGFSLRGIYYPVIEKQQEYILYNWVNEELSFFSLPKNDTVETDLDKKNSTRSTSSVLLGSVTETVYNIFDASRNSSSLATDLHDGRWNDFFKDLGNVIGNNLIDKLKQGGLVGIIKNERINQLKQEQDLHNMSQLYGDANIKITAIDKQIDESYVVNVEVLGISTIQRNVTVVTETTYNDYCENHVYAGIVCRKSYSAFINYYDYKSQEEEITDGDSSVKYISFNLPKLDKGVYYIKPYLRSSVNDMISDTGISYIKYGEEENINVIGGKITGFNQIEARSNSIGYVTFVAYASVELDNNNDLEDWGVYFIKDGLYYRFSSSFPTSKIKDDVRLEFTLARSDFDYIDFDNFMASKRMKIGVFKKYKNLQGVYDYEYYEYGDMTEFDIYYDQKPSLSYTYTQFLRTEPYTEPNDYNWDTESYFSACYDIQGAFFIDKLVQVLWGNWVSPGKTDLSNYLIYDGEHETNYGIIYKRPGSGSTYRSIEMVCGGNVVYSNNYLQYISDGTQYSTLQIIDGSPSYSQTRKFQRESSYSSNGIPAVE